MVEHEWQGKSFIKPVQNLKYFDDFSHVVIWTLKIVALDAGISMRCFFFQKTHFFVVKQTFFWHRRRDDLNLQLLH